jgi:hypothetical protein
MLEKYSKYIVIGVLAIMFAISLGTMLGDAAIMDEVAHIPAGYSYVRYHDFRLNPEHPPLLKDLAGIPLQFLNVDFPTQDQFWTTDANGQWQAGWEFLYLPQNNTEAILFWSRLPILILSLFLGWMIYRWTKELVGIKAGLLALVIYAFDANILGHDHYVTTDLGIAAFMFFAFYFFIKYLKTPSYKTIVLAGIFMGLAQLAKFSSVLMFPVFGLALLLYIFSRKDKLPFSFLGSGKIKKFWVQKFYFYATTFILALLIHLVLIGIVYELNVYSMPPAKIHQLADTQIYGKIATIAKPYIHKMADNPILRPYSQYLIGLVMVFGRVAGGNTTYFFGQVTNQSFKEYFPMVFLIKEPIPNLVLMLMAFATGLFLLLKRNLSRFPKKIWGNIKNYLNGNIAEFSMISFIVLYAYVSITGNLNIGFRHLFPILPFAYVLVAKEITFLGSEVSAKFRKYFWGIILLLLAWLVASAALAYPNYLSYFNELIGGSKNGYKYVTDSNVDWGQDLKRLKTFVDENNIEKIRVDYFGGGDVKHYLGDKATIWHAHMGQENGWYAISATFLQNSLYYKIVQGEADYEWLREREPYTEIGNSILIYKVTDLEK